MLRGNQGKLWAAWLVAGLMLAGPSSTLYARNKPAQGKVEKAAAPEKSSALEKVAAPTMEDHANYFSENRKDVSDADLKRADALRRKTISSIGDLLQSKKKSIRRFELLLRLGELHVERHDYLRDGEMTQYGTAWDAWSKGGKKGKEPQLDVSGSASEMTQGANAFRKLVNEFPKHPRTDAALYSLAKTLARMGKDTAVDYYKQLVKSFPKSALIPDTYLALGEYYFDKHQIPEALTYYQKVLEFKNNRAYPFAVYKLGWAYYNSTAGDEAGVAKNYKKAVTAFKLVVKLADRDKNQAKNRNFDLRDEAIKDLIMVWAESEDVASAWRYFKTIGEQDSFYKMLERLGSIYADQGKNAQSIAVFQRLLKDSPKREGNPAVHAKLLELYDLTNNIPAVVTELRNMHKLYLGNTAWAAANKKNPGAADEATRLVELNTHRYGTIFHQRGQKAKSPAYLKNAADVYALYLASFPQNTNAYDIRYYLAEILYEFKQFEPAAQHYLVVAKQDPKGKYMKPSALNAVAAMNQRVQSTKWPQLPPPGQVPKPLEIPSAKAKFVETIDQYVTLLPKEKDGEPMRFTAAQIFFEYGHYDEAIQRFDKITKEIPDTKQARSAVKVILGYYGDHEDWTKLITWAQGFNKQDKLLDNDLKKYVVDLLRGAMFKRALAYEKAQKYERAAASFLDYQKEFPKDSNADRAMFNAMLNYYKVQKIEAALTTGKSLLDKYPKTEVVPDVLANMGSTFESLARFDEAAAMYERLALTFPKDKRASNALFNAAVLYKGLKNLDKATVLLTTFGKSYGDGPLGADAAMELATLLERKGATHDAIVAYSGYAHRYPSDKEQALLAAAKAAALKIFSENKADGLKDLDKVAKVLSARGAPAAYEARAAVAGALFRLNDPLFGEFQALSINDGNKIEKQVGEKQAKLEKLANNYEKIIELGSSEFTVASLYRLGEAHENFASSLFKAPGPKGASQVDIDRLKTELEKVAFPLKEEAYKYFETAYKRSREVETFTVWTRRTYQKMVDLAPDKHPEVNELSAEPSYLSHDLKISKATSDLIEE